MIRLQKDFAVIATAQLVVKQGGDKINAETVKQFSRGLESQTGIAVINSFTDESLNMFFRNHPDFFKRTYQRDEDGNPIYEIRPMYDLAQRMIQAIDPAVNYPMEILRAAGMLKPLGVFE